MSITALEFFSGLGGLHYGLEFAHPSSKVVAAFDINLHANACYTHNFSLKPSDTSIDRLTAAHLDKFNANCWLLSPPCQPYTQGGKSLDERDTRAEGLLRLVTLLGEVRRRPEFVFLENVPNFEKSTSRAMLVNKLDELRYEIHEFLVSPLQIGIPNDRRRYYLTARLRSSDTPSDPPTIPYIERATIHTEPRIPSKALPTPDVDVDPLSAYLEDLTEDEEAAYLIPEHFVTKRHGYRFDIVQPTSQRSACFTKAYGSHHVIGSGSFLQTRDFNKQIDPASHPAVLSLRPRFFTPTEVARLHAFPVDSSPSSSSPSNTDDSAGMERHGFSFPASITLAQKWRLLGNSLNVRVVGVLMRDVLFR
ncbi:S-adenosyl-L-methionine-dependent methyltransferase [Fimicolochytrium jonesii]|uniref:S-adenosyl-L-methionine-dependent methyltransferase n=1 Tax=Fimicolochytrium jonesii TaxID=1396493 RepID=UPI0022FE76DE|nr:S-adenosyl-L-methionine-dependent methyltransferase [Fimicolochytrium jonesii]KAI8818991.1 S-adenosyl-L-methionine-dependent methyltransferase [Fimicolochytrium jonesii]